MIVHSEPTENSGWDEECNVRWSFASYPDDVADMFMNDDDSGSKEELNITADSDLDESDKDEDIFASL